VVEGNLALIFLLVFLYKKLVLMEESCDVIMNFSFLVFIEVFKILFVSMLWGELMSK